MTAPLTAPVIPSTAAPRHRGRGAQGRVATPLPLAGPPDAPPDPGELIYGIGRIDASGRIADRAITGALNWRSGDRVLLAALPGEDTRRRTLLTL